MNEHSFSSSYARTGQINTLLPRPIVYLVLGAVASVIDDLVMQVWLQNFAFLTSISSLIFVGAVLAGLATAYGTVVLSR